MNQHSKADFRALRESLGLTQQDVADACDVRVLAIKRWERPDYTDPPQDAWEWLEDMADLHDEMVEDTVNRMFELSSFTGAESVAITYFRDQAQYDACGRDEGPVGFVNAVARDVAAELTARGINVAFRYPDDGAISIPGSRY